MARDVIIVKGNPISSQNKGNSKSRWKEAVAAAARPRFQSPLSDSDLRVTITYFFNGIPQCDTDNISKPICDALIGIAYIDDNQVMERHAIRRQIDGAFKLKGVPPDLAIALCEGNNFVCIEVTKVGSEVQLI